MATGHSRKTTFDSFRLGSKFVVTLEDDDFTADTTFDGATYYEIPGSSGIQIDPIDWPLWDGDPSRFSYYEATNPRTGKVKNKIMIVLRPAVSVQHADGTGTGYLQICTTTVIAGQSIQTCTVIPQGPTVSTPPPPGSVPVEQTNNLPDPCA
jgi:hypothetical protein